MHSQVDGAAPPGVGASAVCGPAALEGQRLTVVSIDNLRRFVDSEVGGVVGGWRRRAVLAARGTLRMGDVKGGGLAEYRVLSWVADNERAGGGRQKRLGSVGGWGG